MSWQAFSTFQIAQANFGCFPWELEATRQPELDVQVKRKLALESAVLAHPLAQGLSVAEQDIELIRQGLIKQYGSVEQLGDLLARLGLDNGDLRQALWHDCMVTRVLERVAAGVEPMSDSEARQYYLDHPRRFLRPELREVRHILLTTNDEDANSQSEVLRRIRSLRAELEEEPHQFGDMAQRYSECPTAMSRGRIGKVPRGQLYPELDEVLFALSLGALSQPVLSPMGWHLLQCLGITESTPLPLDEALPQIKAQHLQQARERRQRDWLKALQRQQQPSH